MKRYILTKLNVLLGMILTLLGWSSCDNSDPIWGGVDLYGCPYSKFRVEGAVLDDAGEPVKGCHVVAKFLYNQWESPVPDTLFTAADGTYLFAGYAESDSIRVVANDPSGHLAADSLDIKLTHTDRDKGNWCSGTYEGKGDLHLKQKTNTNLQNNP